MEFRAIRQTSHIDGVNRNPGAGEHLKALVWDYSIENLDGSFGKFTYLPFVSSVANSKTTPGYVAKGDDAAGVEYIWKLDSSKNPAWRKEDYLTTISRSGNSAIFTRNDRGDLALPLGALAWEDSLTSAVTSVFTRTGDVTAQTGDYTAAQVTNAFDKVNNTLDNILEGATNKHFTATYKTKIDQAYAAMHTHSNKAILDLITDAGGGIIPSAAQIEEWDTYSASDAENVMDTVAGFIQNGIGITFTYDDGLDTLTPEVTLDPFTTDDLTEGDINKYYKITDRNLWSITLPSNTTVAGRCAGAVEGVDYPTGWTLTAGDSEYDLLVTHGMTRPNADVTVFSIDGSNNERILVPFSSAYTGIYVPAAKNSIVIEGLSTKETKLRINIIFA